MLRRRRLQWIITLSLAIGFAGSSANLVWAIGYYNLPGSFCQCFGYGNGAGYHSCLVLGPLSCHGFCATHEVRLECSPQPPYGCYSGQPCDAMTNGTWLDGQVPVAPPGPAPTPAAAERQVRAQPRFW